MSNPHKTRPAYVMAMLILTLIGAAGTYEPVWEQLGGWLQVADAHAQRHLAADETEWERLVGEYRKHHDLAPLQRAERLRQAALSHSVDMLRNDFFEVDSPQRGTHQYRVWQTGITDARVYCYIFKTNTGSLAETIASNESFLNNLLSPRLSHIGVGIVAGATRDPMVGDVKFVTVELAERYVELNVSGGGMGARGETVILDGSMAEGLRNPSLIVTQPDGRIVSRAIPIGGDRRYRVPLALAAGAGEYKVEVEAETKMGPMVTNLFPIYADVPWPDPAADYRRAKQRDTQSPMSLDEAKQLMFYLINEERRKAHLSTLRYSFELEALSLGHSKDMKEHDFFAHVSPRLGGLETRARAQGLPYRLIAENIAIDQSVRKAHESLMASPAHRSNILHPQMTDVGIGIVTGSDVRYGRNALWVTQHFAVFYRR